VLHHHLVSKLRGHYNYFGITGNSRALGRFLHEVKRVQPRPDPRDEDRRHVISISCVNGAT